MNKSQASAQSERRTMLWVDGSLVLLRSTYFEVSICRVNHSAGFSCPPNSSSLQLLYELHTQII